MQTVILEQPGRLVHSDTPPPETCAPGEALVRVRSVGICGTDMHAYRGRQPFFTYPRILGHELGVEVIEVNGPEPAVKAGDRCAVEPYLNCGSCIACRAGKMNCCETLKVLGVHVDGGMREVISVPAHKLHRAVSLTADQLALVETLGIGAHAVDRARILPGEIALVIGAGPIGLTVIQFLSIAGARVIVMDVNADRLAFCRRQFPNAEAICPESSAVDRIREEAEGELPTVVFDATGSAKSMTDSFGFAANGGRIVFVGLVLSDITFYDPEFHRKELTLLATRNSTGADFRRIIEFMESGVIDTTAWVTHRTGVGTVVDAFPHWLDPDSGVIKAIINF